MPATHRIGVRDLSVSDVPLYYDQPCFETAYMAFRLLQQYGRDEVTAWIEQRTPEGWKAADQPR